MSIVKPMPTVRHRPWPLWLGLALVALIMVAVAWQRQQPVQAAPMGELKWQLLLSFEDRPGGDIGVINATTQKELALLQGEHGFARGALRTLARERLRRNLGPQTPFELSAYVDGKLVLRDPATGERVHLESFGAANAAVFAQLHRVGLPPSSSHQGVKP